MSWALRAHGVLGVNALLYGYAKAPFSMTSDDRTISAHAQFSATRPPWLVSAGPVQAFRRPAYALRTSCRLASARQICPVRQVAEILAPCGVNVRRNKVEMPILWAYLASGTFTAKRSCRVAMTLTKDSTMFLDSAKEDAALDIPLVNPPSERPPSERPPSVRAERAARQEAALCLSGLDAVSAASSELELELRLASSVFGLRPYERLARYRKQYVLGYIHGARDALARRQGRPVSILPLPDPRVPERIQSLQANARWHRHPNGGGWVSSTAYAALTAYVGPGAVVMERARVLDSARVYGGAIVAEDAEVFDSAHVHGRSVVAGTAVLRGTAHIAGDDSVSSGTHTKGRVK